MDPVTHGIIGAGISALSGQPFSFSNPIVLGSMIGAMSPDIDVITKFWGNYKYLKHHRGISHSPIGLGILSIIIAYVLSIKFYQYSFIDIFIWTFLGAISHTVFDWLNSYGVRCLLPFSRKKYSFNLLMLYDPVITILCLGLIIIDTNKMTKVIFAILCMITYLLIRLFMRKKIKSKLMSDFSKNNKILSINVLPSMTNILKWDFIIETERLNIVGRFNYFDMDYTVFKYLEKANSEYINYIDDTEMGKYFKDFTPFRHITVMEKNKKVVIQMIDLRYYLRDKFMHHATIILDSKRCVIKSVFHPYNLRNSINVEEKKVAKATI